MNKLITTCTVLILSLIFSAAKSQTCNASFTHDTTINNYVEFTADNYNSSLEYYWDFGDGTSTYGESISHSYWNPGNYTVCLNVSDPQNPFCTDSVCLNIVIDTNACNANADYSYTSLGSGEYDFQINNLSAHTMYNWSIENTNYLGSNVNHTFSTNGQFNVWVIATDTTIPSCQDTAVYSVNVTEADTCNYNASFSFNEVNNNYFTFAPDNYDSTASYDWSFGDGNYSTDPYPSHDYSNSGSYTVCLTMWNNSSNGWCADTVCETIIDSTSSCNADLTINTTNNPGEIEFVDNSTTSSGPAATYSWVELYYSSPWQYETTIYLQPNMNTQTYQFTQNGDYTYFFTVQDSITNCMDTLMGTITVNNASSNCSAGFSHLDTINGETYFLPDTYDQNLSYFWDFGDGNYSTDPYPTHTYTSPGTYSACLIVSGNGGMCADTVCQSIVVTNNNVNCIADFYLFQDSINTNVYYIWNLSSGNNLSYTWDFGDGTTSNQQYPSHTYTNQGMYTICLTITDNQSNCSDQYCETIEVLNKATGTTINVVPFGETSGLGTDEEILVDSKIYPNPATSKINIEIEASTTQAYEFEIVDVLGKVVIHGKLNEQGNKQSKSVEVSAMESGVYFIKLINGRNKERVETIKFLKR